MYPKSADPELVDEVVQRSTDTFRRSAGFRSCTTSVDALMGPGAKDGELARVVIVDFDTLEDALGALQSEAFAEISAAGEPLNATHYLFDCHEL
jgi:hypothetical protein